MSRNPVFGLALAALAMTVSDMTALAKSAHKPATPSFIPLGEEGDAPAGFAAMCERTPEFCPPVPTLNRSPRALLIPIGLSFEAAAAAPPRAFNYPELDLAQLRTVNNMVNRRVNQITDARAFGIEDLWRPSGIGRGAVGDCEDLALEKQRQLAAIGYAPSSTLLAVVYSRNVGLHVVLVVRGAQGDFVLDNRSGKVMPWHKARYSWLRIQSPADPTRWNHVGPSAANRTTTA